MTEIPKRIRVMVRANGSISQIEPQLSPRNWDAAMPRDRPHREVFYTLEDKQMEQEKEKAMTGLEALAYLNEKRGERFILAPNTCIITLEPDGELMACREGRLVSFNWAMTLFLDSTFTPCPDPSKPVESDYDTDRFQLLGSSQRPTIGEERKAMLLFIDKHYQRKEPK